MLSDFKTYLTRRKALQPAVRATVMLKEKAYDWRHRVDTAGAAQIENLTVLGCNGRHAVQYEPVFPSDFKSAIDNLDIDYSKFTFIDFGSGKGRALFLASELPFKRIIGVEFAKELHDIATRNIQSYRSRSQHCFDVTSMHVDAAEFQFPPEQLFLYFNNPFTESVMQRVIGNIVGSVEVIPREVYVMCYTVWTPDHLFLNRFKATCLRRTATSRVYRVAVP